MNDDPPNSLVKKEERRGRPKIELDWAVIDKLCEMQCTKKEIAAFFDCSEDTIERAIEREFQLTFSEYFGIKSKLGHIALRRRMYQIAMAGNVTMNIWLSKNWLNFTDKVNTNFNDDTSIEVTLDLGDTPNADKDKPSE